MASTPTINSQRNLEKKNDLVTSKTKANNSMERITKNLNGAFNDTSPNK